jgi:DNA-binding MarR family transcriptional regulator
MGVEDDLLKALEQFNECHEKCHLELTEEINISELKIKQIHYLEIIGRRSTLTLGQFAEILEITKPSVTNIVNQLIKSGCVLKRQCDQDGRKYYIELSEKGEKIAVFKQLKYRRLVAKIIVSLSEPEIRTFVTLLQKIVNI